MTESTQTKSSAYWLLVGLIVFAAAAGGMYLGGKMQASPTAEVDAAENDIFTNLTLTVGEVFPDVELETSSYGRIGSQSVLHPEGTVVLFVESDCSPCHSLSIDWQKMIADGVIAREQVVGISFTDVNRVAEALVNYDIDFPLYADPNFTFMDSYGVDAFPLILVVGKSGIIRYSDRDARRKISPADLRAMLDS